MRIFLTTILNTDILIDNSLAILNRRSSHIWEKQWLRQLYFGYFLVEMTNNMQLWEIVKAKISVLIAFKNHVKGTVTQNKFY